MARQPASAVVIGMVRNRGQLGYDERTTRRLLEHSRRERDARHLIPPAIPRPLDRSSSCVADTETAIALNRAAVEAFENDPDRDEMEKTIAAVIGAAKLAGLEGMAWEQLARLTRLATGLCYVRDGIRHPMFEPKHPVAGKANPGAERWRVYCINAVSARRSRDCSTHKEAQLGYLSDLTSALTLEEGGPTWKLLFPDRSGDSAHTEIDRVCGLLKEWAKPRSLAGASPRAAREHEMLSSLLEAHGPNGWAEAYLALFHHAVKEAKSLIG